jgi:hypothetical protein
MSPSGRWISVHTPLNDYGYGQLAILNTADRSVVLPPKEVGQGLRLFPTGAWSPDERRILMKDYIPEIGELYQVSMETPCIYDIEAARLSCAPADLLAGDMQMSALRADRRAECLAARTCYLAMEIDNVRPDADGFAIDGVIQLQNADDQYSVNISETFAPGVDIVWFRFSARIEGDNVSDLILTVRAP